MFILDCQHTRSTPSKLVHPKPYVAQALSQHFSPILTSFNLCWNHHSSPCLMYEMHHALDPLFAELQCRALFLVTRCCDQLGMDPLGHAPAKLAALLAVFILAT